MKQVGGSAETIGRGDGRESGRGMGPNEFVAFAAMLMILNAIGIDLMLPALPQIGRSLGITATNQLQWIIAVYALGYGAAQIFFGPLADRFGRRPVLLAALVLYGLASAVAVLALDLHWILAVRLMQGILAAAARVLAVSIVRDCYSGRAMARALSMCFSVMIAAPIFAPSIGQAILLIGPWPWIFHSLAIFAFALAVWGAWRLPETLDPQNRRAIALGEIIRAAGMVFGNRRSLGYTLAGGIMTASVMAYINTIQQVFTDVFRRPEVFPIVFASCGIAMGAAGMVNARIVGRYGMRRLSHGAMLGFVGIVATHFAVVTIFKETIWTFALFQAATMACFAVANANFGAIAMEPMGAIAGMAAAVQGTVQHLAAAFIGISISQAYDGTSLPLIVGCFILGVATLFILLIAEHGRLFERSSR